MWKGYSDSCASVDLTPNVEGNRPAAPTVTEDQSMNRRVRLTARLGGDEAELQ
jgi:hypothetical protein